MNPKTPPGIFRHKRIALILVVASLLLGLAFAAPALAAAFPPFAEQGTVPSLPPTRGNDNDDDSQDDFPTATPVSDASAQEPVAPAAATDSQNGAAAFVGRVISPRLNVRSGPALTFGSLGQYLQNDAVTIQFRDGSGQWYYTCCVADTNTSGWSSASFIQPDFDPALAVSLLPVYPGLEQAATPVPAGARTGSNGALTAVVDAQPRLIVRDAPGTEGTIVGRVNDGTTVEVIARNPAGDWWYICCVDGSATEGWANAAFLVADFDAANAQSLIPLFGASDLSLPTPTPRALIFIPKIIKLSTATPTATPLSVEVPAAANTPTPAPTATAAATAAATPTPTLLPEEEATPGAAAPAAPIAAAPAAPIAQQSMTSLTALAWQEPAFAAPGDTVLLRWLISNTGMDVARNVELRNELPAEIALQTGAGSLDAAFTSQAGSEGRSIFALQWAEIPVGESVSATVAVTLSPEMAYGSVLRNLAAIGAQNAAGLTAGLTISTPPSALPTFK